jgi:iron complex outermembrane receptor protein
LLTEPLTTFDVGARYRFNAAGAPMTLRALVTNVFDADGWNVSSNAGFRFIDTRRFQLSLTADL